MSDIHPNDWLLESEKIRNWDTFFITDQQRLEVNRKRKGQLDEISGIRIMYGVEIATTKNTITINTDGMGLDMENNTDLLYVLERAVNTIKDYEKDGLNMIENGNNYAERLQQCDYL